ncbi:hypothetical protein F5884DRAFT_887545 [Xylogone sp. PMI_703]|nr:hypothetical protein F5884DRAFT_887545 [Xylogone sp. PMI_703]
MDEDNNPDRLLTDPTELPSPLHDTRGSMSLSGAPANGADTSTTANGDGTASSTAPPPVQVDPNAQLVQDVVSSEIGVSTLLNRLKQSIASAKEFASFLKERSALEDKHANGLRKLCRMTNENIHKPEQRQHSFLNAYKEVITIHESMADNEAQFAISLHQMHDDLLELASNIDRNRKHWKQQGLSAEQRVADTENLMRKSKAKYDMLSDDYERARTGDRQPGKKFGIKGPKSAAQHEEDLLRKVQAADSDYQSKVQTAQAQRAELVSKLRPEAVQALQDLIKECDAAVTLQMQKFASFSEKLVLSNGLNLVPIKGADQGPTNRSLREVVQSIDNEKDLSNYIARFGDKVPPRRSEIKYERNAVLNPQQQQVTPPPQRQADDSFASRQGPQQPSFSAVQPPQQQMSQGLGQGFNQQPPPPPAIQQHERSFSQGSSGQGQQYGNTGSINQPPRTQTVPPMNYNTNTASSAGPPQLQTLPFQSSHSPPPSFGQQPQVSNLYTQSPVSMNANHLPPLKPVFGLSLDHLFERDGSAVPMTVYQCIQAVDLFGLEVEGIYRLSGTASHITKLRAMFDNDASKVDFRNPENFYHDVNSVAGLLKQFFRDLPDPLMTREHYSAFIEAAKNEDDIVRRDSLHAIINSLPDPNYATLRALTLHLNRVQQNSSVNRMNSSNLAIVFGPTLMGANTGPNIQDAGWQVRVIDTILTNTYQIFDDD